MKHTFQTPLQKQPTIEFECLEMDDGFVERIHATSSWRVHSTFRQVINLVSGHLMVTLATQGNTLMPYTLISSASDFSIFSPLRNQQVTIEKNCITVDPAFFIQLRGALKSSHYSPIGRLINRHIFEKTLCCLEKKFQNKAAKGSFLVNPDASPFDKELQRMLIFITTQFCMAIKKNDFNGSVTHAKSLIGLGAGLTPSGDDYLVGFFAVHLLDKKNTHWFTQLAHAVLNKVEEKTNLISATYLNSLKELRFKTEIANLVNAVYTQETRTVEKALEDLLKIGSTSGTDIAKGIIDAFHLHMELLEEEYRGFSLT